MSFADFFLPHSGIYLLGENVCLEKLGDVDEEAEDQDGDDVHENPLPDASRVGDVPVVVRVADGRIPNVKTTPIIRRSCYPISRLAN